MSDVASLLAVLRREGGEPPAPLTDPYAIVLHENAGYLVDDARRDALYGRLISAAPNAAALLAAPHDLLRAIARDGGMNPDERIGRWRTIASITLDEADGDLSGTLRSLPIERARKLLARFPAIGAPGVDRILLFGAISDVPAVESNGLRVLERYGAIPTGLPYARSYRNACAALTDAFGADGEALRSAYLLLRRHGKTICRRAAPACETCPARRCCPKKLGAG